MNGLLPVVPELRNLGNHLIGAGSLPEEPQKGQRESDVAEGHGQEPGGDGEAVYES